MPIHRGTLSLSWSSRTPCRCETAGEVAVITAAIATRELLVVNSNPVFSSFAVVLTTFNTDSGRILIYDETTTEIVELVVAVAKFYGGSAGPTRTSKPFFETGDPGVDSVLGRATKATIPSHDVWGQWGNGFFRRISIVNHACNLHLIIVLRSLT